MRHIALPLAATVALTAAAAVFAQWGPRGCPTGPVGPSLVALGQSAAWEWRDVPDANQKALYRNGVHVGSWNADGGYYRAITASGWGEREAFPPHPLPVETPVRNFGVDISKLPGRETYELDGKACTKQMVWKAMGTPLVTTPDLTDDSTLPRLVCVGTAEECKAALSNPSLAVVLPKVQVVGRGDQLGFRPDDYWPRARGYGPGFYLVKPDGTKLWSASSWDGAAQPILDALAGKAPSGTPANSPWLLLIVGGAFLLFFLLAQRKAVA